MGIRGARRHHDGTRSARGMPTAMGAAANGTTSRPHRSDRFLRTSLASTTWPATYGNGCRIAIMMTTTVRPRNDLVRDGLATAEKRETRARRQPIQVTWFAITDAGRQALAG
jgi:hypothetical protein